MSKKTKEAANQTCIAPRRPKRLLTIGHSYVLSVNRRLAHELQRQSNSQWEVSVVAPSYFKGRSDIRSNDFRRLDDEPIHVDAIKARWTGRVHLFQYEKRLREIVQSGFDLVHAWEEPYIFAGLQIARATPLDVPLVFRTAQSLDKSYPLPFRAIEKYCVERMSGWIYSGFLVEQNLLGRPGYQARPRCHAALGFDADAMFVDRDAGDAVRRQLGWDNTVPVIGYLGRLVVEKGLRVLMETMDGMKTPWRVILVGDGPMRDELSIWAKRHPGQVALCTDVDHDNVARYINAMDMLVAPSLTGKHWREQFGRMLVEAFACGVPVIGSDSGEIPYVIRDTGMIVPENDSVALALAITQMMGDSAGRKDFAARGLERAHSEFTWSKIARKTLDFFEEILDESKL